MRQRPPPALLLLPLVAACGAGAGPDTPSMRILDRALTAAASSVAADTSLGSEAGFYKPTDLRFLGDSLALLESQGSRVVVLGPDGRPGRTVGKEGSGPGELETPWNLAVWNGQLVVSDLTNARVTFFGRDGRATRTVRLADGAASFDVGADGTLYTTSGSREHYLQAVDPAGTARAFAPRPLDLYGKGDIVRKRPAGAGRELVVVTDDAVHVFDNQVGVLVKYDLSGKRLLTRSLPPEILRELNADRALAAKDFGGGSGAGIPLAKDLTVTDQGQLFLFFPASRLFGLLVDPAGYDARPLRLPRAKEESRPLYAASHAIMRRSHVYLFHADYLSVHALRETP